VQRFFSHTCFTSQGQIGDRETEDPVEGSGELKEFKKEIRNKVGKD